MKFGYAYFAQKRIFVSPLVEIRYNNFVVCRPFSKLSFRADIFLLEKDTTVKWNYLARHELRSHIVQKHASEFHQKAVDFLEKHITIETKPAVVKHTVKSILSPDYKPPQEGVNLCSMCNTCYRSFGKVTIFGQCGYEHTATKWPVRSK